MYKRQEQLTDRRVAVRNSIFRPEDSYTLKVEGAKMTGYRVITIAGARDPRFIERLDEIIEGVEERTRENFNWEKMCIRDRGYWLHLV